MPVLSTDTARLNGMPKPSAATTPFHLVYGGDSYLNDQTVRDLKHEAHAGIPTRKPSNSTRQTPTITPSTRR